MQRLITYVFLSHPALCTLKLTHHAVNVAIGYANTLTSVILLERRTRSHLDAGTRPSGSTAPTAVCVYLVVRTVLEYLHGICYPRMGVIVPQLVLGTFGKQ
jgi:hypothetical protein